MALVALVMNETKSLLVADCIEKLTALSEYHVTIMWALGLSGVKQK